MIRRSSIALGASALALLLVTPTLADEGRHARPKAAQTLVQPQPLAREAKHRAEHPNPHATVRSGHHRDHADRSDDQRGGKRHDRD